MISYFKILLFKLVLIIGIFFNTPISFSENHDLNEIIRQLQSDIKTLEKAVYSGSNSLAWSKNRRSVTVKAN
mgnify:CR=1 FL=1